jgi:hypothetical protein
MEKFLGVNKHKKFFLQNLGTVEAGVVPSGMPKPAIPAQKREWDKVH